MAKVVQVFRVDYEITNRPEEKWTAYVAGHTGEEVQKYIENFVTTGRVVINTLSQESRLDAVTDEVRRFIAQPLLGVINNEPPAEEEEKKDNKKPQKRTIVPKTMELGIR